MATIDLHRAALRLPYGGPLAFFDEYFAHVPKAAEPHGVPVIYLGQNRRMSKDYERLPESSEAFVYVAMSRLMVRRLAR